MTHPGASTRSVQASLVCSAVEGDAEIAGLALVEGVGVGDLLLVPGLRLGVPERPDTIAITVTQFGDSTQAARNGMKATEPAAPFEVL